MTSLSKAAKEGEETTHQREVYIYNPDNVRDHPTKPNQPDKL